MIYIDGRFLNQRITGVQRFALELSSQLILDKKIKLIAPKNTKLFEPFNTDNTLLVGPKNINIWEHLFLPLFLKLNKSPLLLCFTGLGPIFYNNKIMTIHDLSFLENPKWFSKKYAVLYKILTPLSAKNSQKVLTVSNYSKKIITSKLGINESKIEIVYNAVKTPQIHESIDKKKYILTVGTLDPRKNIKRLINAFIKWNNKDYELLIIGGNQKQFPNTNYSSHKNVKLLGYLSDYELSMLYYRAEIFIYPSLYEGFGIPPLEAMAHGTPVIVSNTTSLPEVCGNAAFYINPYSEESILEGIDSLVKSHLLRDDLVKKGFKNIKRFSWELSAQKLNETILKLR